MILTISRADVSALKFGGLRAVMHSEGLST